MKKSQPMKKSELRQIIREEISKILNESNVDPKIGDLIHVLKNPISRLKTFYYSNTSIWFEKELQLQKGDVWEVKGKNTYGEKDMHYMLLNKNRPQEVSKALGINKQPLIIYPVSEIQNLITKGIIEVIPT